MTALFYSRLDNLSWTYDEWFNFMSRRYFHIVKQCLLGPYVTSAIFVRELLAFPVIN